MGTSKRKQETIDSNPGPGYYQIPNDNFDNKHKVLYQ